MIAEIGFMRVRIYWYDNASSLRKSDIANVALITSTSNVFKSMFLLVRNYL